MKLNAKTSLTFLLIGCFSCDSSNPLGLDRYGEMGTFESKFDAQNATLSHIAGRFNRLPSDDFYRVIYSFHDADPAQGNRHAIWYHKTEQRLGVEVDINSGMTCTWYEVDRVKLEEIVKAGKGIAGVDSLAKSVYNNKHCQ